MPVASTLPDPPLRILMLAPEPFFEPRGTPFSEYHRIKALLDLGHRVDLVTYPFGSDVSLPGLRIFRAAKPPFAKGVRVGPSGLKVVLDALLVLTALRVARRGRHDAVHSHEEGGVLGVLLSRWLGVPHLYDMHSSLPQQLDNFRYAQSSLVRRLFERIEQFMIGRSRVVITICQELQDAVVQMGAGDRAVLIENCMGGDVEEVPGPGRRVLRESLGIDQAAPLALYTGTFESYQGLAMLTAASVLLAKTYPAARVLVVGGTPDQVTRARAEAEAAGAPMIFTGQRPPHEIPHLVDACDFLVSPRISGTNTPLKIYSYLRSDRPIVATNLVTHTQVLTPGTALLVEPEPDAFARGMARLIDHPDEGRRLAAAALALARSTYSREAYLERTRRAYALLLAPPDQAHPAQDAPRGTESSEANLR